MPFHSLFCLVQLVRTTLSMSGSLKAPCLIIYHSYILIIVSAGVSICFAVLMHVAAAIQVDGFFGSARVITRPEDIIIVYSLAHLPTLMMQGGRIAGGTMIIYYYACPILLL